tara:strand:- start:501 stop:2315 length:1815 start_codon:yes stop_codon:yes gene_type:complete
MIDDDDLILKGKGVYKRDLKTKKMVPMSFPPINSPHKEMSHFHINHQTGKPHKEIPDNMRHWPMQAAANYLASNKKMQQLFPGNLASRKAKEIMNKAAIDFNKNKRGNGDDFHTVPIPFDSSGNLHPEYRTNHYGAHESRRVPTSSRKTRDEKGNLINLHFNSVAHPTLGRFLESGAFHFEKEFRKIINSMGVESDLGSRQNVLEPQQIVRAPEKMADGSIQMKSLLQRYDSNMKDPTSKDNHHYPEYGSEKYNESTQYGQIRAVDIIASLPNAFFEPTTRGRPPRSVISALIREGVSPRRAEAMARAPAAQLIMGRGKKGSQTQLNNIVGRIQEYIGIEGANKDNSISDTYHKHRSHFDGRVGGSDRGRTDAAKRILATLKTAEELGIDITPATGSSQPPASVVSGWKSFALQQGGKSIDLANMGMAQEHHHMQGQVTEDLGHLHDTLPDHISVGGYDPMQDNQQLPPGGAGGGLPLNTQGTQQPSATDPFGPEGSVATRNDQQGSVMTSQDDPMGAIAAVMERVQMHDTWDDAKIMKGVKYQNLNPRSGRDMGVLAKQLNLESNDVRAIAMSIGNWSRLAEHFQVRRDVVNIIKASCLEVST